MAGKMGYIENIRAIVGHRPLILIGAGVLVFNSKQELLLLLRTDNKTWGIPGGMMEPGETLEETAQRETLEETALCLESMRFFKIYSGPDQHYHYPNGDEVYNVSVIFIADKPEGEIVLNKQEHTEFNFFPLDALPYPIHPMILQKIKDYINENV
jgi:8-oxo-dGTP pyrophosphatase MutT (NUDIX family)